MKYLSKDNDGVKTVKFIARTVVGYSVSGVIVSVLHQNTKTFTTTQKVQLYVGAAAVGAMVSDAARDYVDKQIDNVVDFYNEVAKSVNKSQLAA